MAPKMNSFRLLPVTILMTGLLLGVKCLDVGLRVLAPGLPTGQLPGSIVRTENRGGLGPRCCRTR